MIRRLIAGAALLQMSGLVPAQAKPPSAPPEPKIAADTIDAIQAEVGRVLAGARKGGAPDAEALERAIRRFFDFAADHAGSEEGLESLRFALQFAYWLPDARYLAVFEEGMEALIDGYLDRPRTWLLVSWLRSPKPCLEERALEYLDWIERESTNGSIRCACEYVRALRAYDAAGQSEDSAKALVAALKALSERYGDLPSHAGGRPWSEVIDEEIRPFVIAGTAAPEIAGDDLDGVPFKLSDYRGKVVLLDFWGFW